MNYSIIPLNVLNVNWKKNVLELLLQKGVINNYSQLVDRDGAVTELSHIKSLNADGVVVDCWWGIVESWSPQKYVWSGYRELFNLIREFNLKMQVFFMKFY